VRVVLNICRGVGFIGSLSFYSRAEHLRHRATHRVGPRPGCKSFFLGPVVGEKTLAVHCAATKVVATRARAFFLLLRAPRLEAGGARYNV